ncbi:MAG: hypothetical protein ACWA49_04815 [Ruegeria sp.]
MTRVTVISTAIGLMGLVTAMLSALGSHPPASLLALGFAMMGLGILGAVIGAVATLSHAWQPNR